MIARRFFLLLGLLPFSLVALGQAAPAIEVNRLAFRFEAHSSRLAPFEADHFAEIARILRELPDATLVILLPQADEMSNRRFVTARAAELQRHLQMIGLTAVLRRNLAGAGDEDRLYIAVEAPTPQTPSVSQPVLTPPAQIPAEISSSRIWRAESGRTLRELLNDWAEQAGWTVVWQSPFDYPLAASASLTGDFPDVVTQVMRGFDEAKPPPTARMHPANRVVIIQ